jgi:uncharacterized membrane protein YdjX (TVP38/TMEM64 family)
MHWLRKLGVLGPLAAFAVFVPPVSGIVLIGTLHKVGPWLQSHQEAGLLFYVVAFVVLGGLALLPTYAQSMLGGWAFGPFIGTCAALVGFVGAALVSYQITRRISGNRGEQLLEEHTKWNAVYAALIKSSFWQALLIITLLRLPPNSPFAASNLAMAAIRVPRLPFALGTLIGMAPRTSVVVFAGAGLATLDFSNREQTGFFAAGLAATLAVVGIIGLLANRALRQVERQLGAVDAAEG